MGVSKAAARSIGQSFRSSLTKQEYVDASTQTCMNLQTILDWSRVVSVLIYDPIFTNNELDVTGFTHWLQNTHSGLDVTLQSRRPVFPDEKQFSVVIVPVSAVDTNGSRVGYGGGHYDRFLATQEHAKFVAVAFEGQIVDGITPESHDIPMHCIVTEIQSTWL